MKFLLIIFKEVDLPKINHLGKIMVDYNHLFDMEDMGFTPIYKDLEVSRSIWESIQYAPTGEADNEFIKWCTDEGIELSYKRGYLEEDDYKELKEIMAGKTFKKGNLIYQEELNDIIEEAGGQINIDDLIEKLKNMKVSS
jgi:hypothetical protein